MLKIKGPDHLVLKVRDMAAMIHFYHDLLGLELIIEEYKAGKRPFPSVRVGETLIDLFPLKEGQPLPEKNGTLHHFCLRLDDSTDLEEVKTFLAGNAVELAGVSKNNWGAYGYGDSLYVLDPDGNMVELKVYR